MSIQNLGKNWDYESVFRKMSPLEKEISMELQGLAPKAEKINNGFNHTISSNPIKWVAIKPNHAVDFKSDGRKHRDYNPENYQFLLEYRLTLGTLDELEKLKSEGIVQKSKKSTFGIPPEMHYWFNNRVNEIKIYDLKITDTEEVLKVLGEENIYKDSAGYLMRKNKVILFQAFSPEFLEYGGFSNALNMGRMSWLKTSILWTLFRSNWGRKDGQEKILEIEVPMEYVLRITESALSTKQQGNAKAPLIYQIDPDRHIIGRRWSESEDYWVKGGSTKHYGIRDYELENYVNNKVPGNIRDITNIVQQIESERPIHPTETLYNTLSYMPVSLIQLKNMQKTVV